jgi:hypothetical protein
LAFKTKFTETSCFQNSLILFKDPPVAKHAPFRTAIKQLSPKNFSKIFK